MKMSIKTLFFLTIFLATSLSSAFAQRGIGANVGLAIPMGDLGDVSGTGYSIGAEGFFHMLDIFPNLRGGGRVAFNSFSDNNYDQFGADVSSSATVIEIAPSLRYLFTRPEREEGFFAQFGLGLFITSVSFENFPDAEDDTQYDFGVTLGAGGTYRLLDNLTAVAMPLVHLSDFSSINISIGLIFGRREAKTATAQGSGNGTRISQ
ncbi:MAG: outer membrane beta-barrel protein [Candidatus Latescibacterota bacterium]